MNIAICDDVALYNTQLRQILSDYIDQNHSIDCSITEYDSGQALLKDYRRGLFDYIFLDVEMPALDGFAVAEKIRTIDTTVGIVFVTNMTDQMRMGFRYNAKDYLCKPVTPQQIGELMSRLIDEYHKNDLGIYTIKLKFDEGVVHLKLADIIYFESKDRDVLATTIDDAFTFRGPLSVVEDALKNKGFVRINRSFLVNSQYVFKHFGDRIQLKSGERFIVSRKYRVMVDKIFGGRW